jgi:hypothetical protein
LPLRLLRLSSIRLVSILYSDDSFIRGGNSSISTLEGDGTAAKWAVQHVLCKADLCSIHSERGNVVFVNHEYMNILLLITTAGI